MTMKITIYVVKNTHEAIGFRRSFGTVRGWSNRCRRASVTVVAQRFDLLSDCGNKVRLAWNNTGSSSGSKKKPRKYIHHNYNWTSSKSYMNFRKAIMSQQLDGNAGK